jgi:hypothetical protein
MWSDKETSEDLLGYTVHSSLLKSVITNEFFKDEPINPDVFSKNPELDAKNWLKQIKKEVSLFFLFRRIPSNSIVDNYLELCYNIYTRRS